MVMPRRPVKCRLLFSPLRPRRSGTLERRARARAGGAARAEDRPSPRPSPPRRRPRPADALGHCAWRPRRRPWSFFLWVARAVDRGLFFPGAPAPRVAIFLPLGRPRRAPRLFLLWGARADVRARGRTKRRGPPSVHFASELSPRVLRAKRFDPRAASDRGGGGARGRERAAASAPRPAQARPGRGREPPISGSAARGGSRRAGVDETHTCVLIRKFGCCTGWER